MAKNTLYVFDEKADPGKSISFIHEAGTVFVCPMTTHQEIISSVIESMEINNLKVIHIRFNVLLNEKAFSIREEYIRFIAEFADKKNYDGKNLKELLKYPFHDFSTWWFSLVSEKNPLKTDSYHKLAKLLTLLDLQKKYDCTRIVLDIEDNDLAFLILNHGKKAGYECISARKVRKTAEGRIIFQTFSNSFVYFFELIFKVVLVKAMMRKSRGLAGSRFLLVTYFPLADTEKLKHKIFINRYYHPLQAALEKKGVAFTWLALNVAEGRDLVKNITLGKQINKWGHNLFFCEEWLTIPDFIIMVSVYLYTSIKFFMKMPRISGDFKYPASGINIWYLFRKDWYASFSGTSLIQGTQYYLSFKRVFGKLKKGTFVCYLAEMLAWEKALNIASKEKKGLKVIGIQHTTIPLLYLTHFNDRIELQGDDNINNVPRPGYLASGGRIQAKILLDSGWKEAFVWGAVRYQQYRDYLDVRIPWESRENKILVALTYDFKESEELLYFVHTAFKDQDRIQVIIKGHPFLPIPKLLGSLNFRFDEKTFKFVETPLSELLPAVRAMVVAGSSASLESIVFQCPIIIPRLTGVIDMNPLLKISGIPVYVDSPDMLHKAASQIMESTESPITYEKCKTLIENYFEFLDSDEEFVERLEKLGKID